MKNINFFPLSNKQNKQTTTGYAGIHTADVPLFKNPNSNTKLTNESLISYNNSNSADTSLWQLTGLVSKNLDAATDDYTAAQACKVNKNNSKICLLNNLVFLQPKGSPKPNPTIISYNFNSSISVPNCPLDDSLNDDSITEISSDITNDSLNLDDCSTQEDTLNYQRENSDKIMASSGSKNVYKLLFHFFKSMYCLISKPVFISTQDKLKIQLFYFLLVPKIITKINKINFVFNSKFRVPFNRTNKKFDFASCSSSRANNRLHFNLFKTKKQKKSLLAWKRKNWKIRNQLLNVATDFTKEYSHKFKLICTILSTLFNKPVELELIRIHHPYFDSNILVNFLALIINKKNIRRAIKRLYSRKIIIGCSSTRNIKSNSANILNNIYYNNENELAAFADTNNSSSLHKQKVSNSEKENVVKVKVNAAFPPTAYLSGLNIKINGRLMREAIRPRRTKKKFEKGFTAKGKINYSDVARFTSKNRKGAFTITVKSGQNFF